MDAVLKDFTFLSNGKTYNNPKFFRILKDKLAKVQRILFRKTKVARIHEHITNVKADYLHKLSTEIIKNHNVIGMED